MKDIEGKEFNVGCEADGIHMAVRFTREPYEVQRHGGWIDLQCAEDCVLMPKEIRVIPLGVNVMVPNDMEVLLLPRSSTCLKYGVTMANSMGVIDWEYCGDADELGFIAYNCTDQIRTVPKGARIAQMKIVYSMERVVMHVAGHMERESRGGFGSTGM